MAGRARPADELHAAAGRAAAARAAAAIARPARATHPAVAH